MSGKSSAGLGNVALGARRALKLTLIAIRLFGPFGLRRLLRLRPKGPTGAERVRMALEQLGITYLKLGQYLAMRFDVLPAEVCRELGKLFDEVEPMAPADARSVIEEDLGHPLEELYTDFTPEPIAAASIAQVHEAWLADGTHVAVKVQRLGLERVLVSDLRNMRRLTRLLDRFHALGRLSATEMLDQFATWTLQELDFEIEGRTADAVGAGSGEFDTVPKVYAELSSPRVLTLEFVDGVSLAKVVRLADEGGAALVASEYPGLDVDEVLHNLTNALLGQIFVGGLFHGDPHPGNVLVQEGNKVAFVDFGIFGELGPADRDILGGQIENLALGNVDESLRYYLRQLTITDETDVRAFRAEARSVLDEWYSVSLNPEAPLSQRHLGRYVGQMIDVSRRYGLQYDMNYLLYWRALNALDSTALRMSDQFDLIAELRSFFEQIRPDLVERLFDLARDRRNRLLTSGLARDVPRSARDALDDLVAGRSPVLIGASDGEERRGDGNGATAAVAAGLLALSSLILVTRTEAPAYLDALLVAGAGGAVLPWLRTVRT